MGSRQIGRSTRTAEGGVSRGGKVETREGKL